MEALKKNRTPSSTPATSVTLPPIITTLRGCYGQISNVNTTPILSKSTLHSLDYDGECSFDFKKGICDILQEIVIALMSIFTV